MKTFLLLGSNEGDRIKNLVSAKQFIVSEIAPVVKESAIYETAPWGNSDQPSFLNQVIEIDITIGPEALLKVLKSIERKMGRKRFEKWGPRIIDIDILFIDGLIHESKSLIVPHPHLHKRRFTLVPLNEIVPEFQHPVLGLTIQELLSRCEDVLEVNPLPVSEQQPAPHN